MAGLGRKVFTAGEVLTAANVQGYLQDQVVQVYASSAVRATAVGTATEGMMSYLTDTNAVQYYDGAAWQNVSASISGGTAGQAYVSGGTAAPGFGKVTTTFTTKPVANVSAAYTAVAGDANEIIVANGTAAYTLTFPDVLSIGDTIEVYRDSSGTVTLAAGTGVTTWAGAGTAGTAVTFKIDQQYNGAAVTKVAANSYRVIGKIAV